jgi:hypothetical protein
MAVLELAVIIVAFGAMAIVFAAQERAEWRRLVARGDAVLAREHAPEPLTFEAAPPAALRDAA